MNIWRNTAAKGKSHEKHFFFLIESNRLGPAKSIYMIQHTFEITLCVCICRYFGKRFCELQMKAFTLTSVTFS